MKPVLQALLVADHVYCDRDTDKKVVAGVFHCLWFKKPRPLQGAGQADADTSNIVHKSSTEVQRVGSPRCYISLTDVRGEQKLDLRYVNLRDEKVLFQADIKVKSDDPLETVEIFFPLPPLPSHEAGTFALELLWKDIPLGSHRIIVREAIEEESDGN